MTDMLGLANMNEEKKIQPDSYSEAKGRGIDAAFVNSILVGGELTDNQLQPVPADQHVAATAAQDDVGATASSTNSATAHKPAGDLAADKQGDKDRGSFPVGGPVHSNSPAAIPLGAANSAGEADSSPASPAPNHDDEPGMPYFLRRPGSWSDENLPSRRATEQ